MKKLTLLGDSIRLIGYGEKTAELLKDEFETFQPDDNCRFSKYTLRGVLYEWKDGIAGSDVIHWNNGLWDICDLGDGVFTPIEEYKANMLRIADLLQKQAKKVIFATTTPVRKEHQYNDNETIKEYNSVIVPILQKRGIIINDLFSLVYPDIERYIREDDLIHLTDEGIELCSKKVCECIKEAARDL